MYEKTSPVKTTLAAGADAHLTFSPTPRPVRMKRDARALLLFLILLLVVEAGFFVLPTLQLARSQRGSATPDPGNLFVGVSIPLVTALYLFTLFRHRALLRDGSVAIGRITETLRGSGWIHYGSMGRNVAFEFQDSAMQVVCGKRIDRDRSAHQGMAMPVFFDPNNSRHNLPLCSSFYELSRISAAGQHEKAITREK